MAFVGDKARVTKGHSVGHEDTITRMFLASSGNIVYQLGYNFVQCQRDEFEIIEHAKDVHQQYHVGETRNVLSSRFNMTRLEVRQYHPSCTIFAQDMRIFTSYIRMNLCPLHIHYFRRSPHVQSRRYRTRR